MKCCLTLISVFALSFAQNKQAGFVNKVEEEVSDEACTSSDVPTWIDGYLMRQICGGFGPTNAPAKQHLTHLFDCMAMVSKFDFRGGAVTYSNKYIDSKQYNIWKDNNMDMIQSKVAWKTDYSEIDKTAYDANKAKHTDKPDINPNLGFWRIGNRVQAVTEVQKGFEFDIANLEMKGLFKFTDDNLGLPQNTVFVNNVADEIHDADGNLWSSVIAFEPRPAQYGAKNIYDVARIVYKIDKATANRTIVGSKITSLGVDLNKCQMSGTKMKWIYNDENFKEGYMHSMVMTENYVILPITSFFLNPCLLLPQVQNDPKPELGTWYTWDSNTASKFMIIRKKDGQFIKTISVTSTSSAGSPIAVPVFLMHSINAYEDPTNGNLLIVDLLTYNNRDKVYRDYFQLSYLMDQKNSFPQETTPWRFTLDISNGHWAQQKLNKNDLSLAAEFPNINPAFRAKQYRFSYMLMNPYSDQSMITKYDFNSKTETPWNPFSASIYLSEPLFLQEPGKTGEDEGVLLVPGFNSTDRKGIVYIINAKDMKPIGQTIAPKFTPFGFHNRFYSRSELGTSGSQKTLAAFLIVFSAVFVLLR